MTFEPCWESANWCSSSGGDPRSRRRRPGAVFGIGLLLTASAIAGPRTVELEMGPAGQTLRRTIDAPNLSPPNSSQDRWIPATAPAAVPRVPARPAVTGRNTPQPAGPQRFPHLLLPARSAGPAAPPAPGGLDTIAGGSAPPPADDLPVVAVVNGGDSGGWTATRDGQAVLQPLLRTRDGATMIVRLFDASGQEVLFDGKSLMEWRRPDDTTNAPLRFRGQADARSMLLEQAGDYSPRPGLAYTVPVTQGQRITIEVSGRPESDSEFKLRSNAMR